MLIVKICILAAIPAIIIYAKNETRYKEEKMCKSKYKNNNPSTLYLLRGVIKMVAKYKKNINFVKNAMKLEIAINKRYLISPPWGDYPQKGRRIK